MIYYPKIGIILALQLKIIEDNDEINNQVILYVKNGNKEKFKEDLISLIKYKKLKE